jgi:hypothetical protein
LLTTRTYIATFGVRQLAAIDAHVERDIGRAVAALDEVVVIPRQRNVGGRRLLAHHDGIYEPHERLDVLLFLLAPLLLFLAVLLIVLLGHERGAKQHRRWPPQ